MAASENSSGNQQQEHFYFNGGASTSNGNSGPGPGPSSGYDSSVMKHNPGIDVEWTSEEQSILENGLTQYASVSSIIRYAKIAMDLPNKTVRDVALRARWMNKKEVSKRRKEDHSRKSKDKREKINESSSKSSHVHASRPNGHPYPLPALPVEEDDGISCNAIGGPAGDFLAQNQQFFQQISNNINSYQLQDNISLFCQVRDNIFKIMNNFSLNDTPEIMKQMPPLPVNLNEQLVSHILPTMNHQKPS